MFAYESSVQSKHILDLTWIDLLHLLTIIFSFSYSLHAIAGPCAYCCTGVPSVCCAGLAEDSLHSTVLKRGRTMSLFAKSLADLIRGVRAHPDDQVRKILPVL